jgi:hypothetical protein
MFLSQLVVASCKDVIDLLFVVFAQRRKDAKLVIIIPENILRKSQSYPLS